MGSRSALGLALILTALAAGCDDDGDPIDMAGTTGGMAGSSGDPPVSYASEIQPIWAATCVTDCHEPSGNADLTTGLFLGESSYSAVVGAPAVQAELPLVAAGDPSGSYLWLKISPDDDHLDVGIGGAMPLNEPPLSAAQLALIRNWIEDGALP